MTASGTSGFGAEYARIVELTKLGAVVTKTVTPRPRRGNVTPRTVETPSGMLNSIGLPNPGIEGLLAREGRAWESLGMPVIVSIAGGSAWEFRDLAAALEGYPGVSAIEANFSCPNVEDGMEFATDPELLALATGDDSRSDEPAADRQALPERDRYPSAGGDGSESRRSRSDYYEHDSGHEDRHS